MAIDFFTVDGAFLYCRRCDERNFVQALKVMELWEDEQKRIPFMCEKCRFRQWHSIERARGQHREELRKMTVKRFGESL